MPINLNKLNAINVRASLSMNVHEEPKNENKKKSACFFCSLDNFSVVNLAKKIFKHLIIAG
jgi:hypothetical protein